MSYFVAWMSSLLCALITLVVAAALYADGIRHQAPSEYTGYTAEKSTIRVVTALIPPNMNESGKGREADVITHALSSRFKTVQFFVEPFGRQWHSYETDSRFDAVTTVPDEIHLAGYRSAYYITYRNGIGYKPETFSKHVGDIDFSVLIGKRVITFPGASHVITTLAERIPTFSLYVEREDQRMHSLLLMNDRVDAVIADGMIFSEYNRIVAGKELAFSAILPPTCYRMYFRNVDDRNAFDAAIAIMANEGRLYEIDSSKREQYAAIKHVPYTSERGQPCER